MSEVKDYLEDVHQLKAEVHHLPLESGSTVELNVISNSESPTWLSVEKFLSNSFCPELMHRNIRGVMLRNLCQIRETLRKENSNDPSSLNFYYLQHSRLSKRAEDHLDLLQQCLVLNAKVKLTKNLQLVTAEPLKNKSNRLSFFCNAIVVVYADQDSVKTKEVPQVVEETDVELFTEKPEIQEDVELIYPKEEETEEEKTDETEAEDNENFIRSKCRSELHYSQHMTDSCHEVSFSQLDKVMLITFELFLDKRSTELSSFLIVNCLNSENSISDNCETLVTRLWQDQILQDADVEATVLPELLSLPKYSDVSDLLSSCDFAQMSEVYLCGCELKSLEGLETLMNLKKLVACHNQLKNLTELPECLTDLNISFNYLTGIPVNLKPCSHLNSLDFSCNCVTDLAGFFDSLVKFAPKLQELEARWNDTVMIFNFPYPFIFEFDLF